jgi:hypothetical protein
MKNAPEDESELTDAEQAWVTELNRLGTEEGLPAFPAPPTELHVLVKFFAGLTPLEAIEQRRPPEPPPDDE